jgi:hypothetical protein
MEAALPYPGFKGRAWRRRMGQASTQEEGVRRYSSIYEIQFFLLHLADGSDIIRTHLLLQPF